MSELTTHLVEYVARPDDERVMAAARGMRPHFDDTVASAPPLSDDGLFHFAPSAPIYKVSRFGDGTMMVLHGVDPVGHLVCVVASGYYPHLFVRVAQSTDIVRLVTELDTSLAAIVASDEKRSWAPEFSVVRETLVGGIRPTKDKQRLLLFRPAARTTVDWRRRRPIVGYELIDVTMLRGSGVDCGYQGLEPRHYLKIYLYSPTLIVKCRSLLHGRYAELGWRSQIERLAGGGSSMGDRMRDELARNERDPALCQDEPLRTALVDTLEKYQSRGSAMRQWAPEAFDFDVDAGDLVVDAASAAAAEESASSAADMLEEFDEAMTDDIDDEALVFDDDDDDEYNGNPHDAPQPHSRVSPVLHEEDNTKLGKQAMEEHVNPLFRAAAMREAQRCRASSRSYLSALRENNCMIVCEADIDFTLRFAIDAGFAYEQWVAIDLAHVQTRENCHMPRTRQCSAAQGEWEPPDAPPGIEPVQRVRWVTKEAGRRRRSVAQIELHCDFHALHLSPDAALQNMVPPRVTVSLDCEMRTAPGGGFPQPESESVLQVCAIIPIVGEPGRQREVVFCLGRPTSGLGRWVYDDDDDDAQVDEQMERLAIDASAPAVEGDALPGGAVETLAIVGTRTFDDSELMESLVARIDCRRVVTGCAAGADQLARTLAEASSLPLIVHRADWSLGRRAGPLRNALIVRDATHVLAFWDGKSPGTLSTVRQARAAGVPCSVVRYDRPARSKRSYDEAMAPPRASRRRQFVLELAPEVESQHVLPFEHEVDALAALAYFMRALVPRKITTYNGDNFDLPYLIKRSEVLGIGKHFIYSWGMAAYGSRLRVRERIFQSKAHGKHEYREITAEGQLFFDLFQYLKRNPAIKLRQYSLNAVAKEFVGMQKEDVAYSQINTLQLSPDGRRKLYVYCLRDCVLPQKIDDTKTIEAELVEKARATGVTLNMLLKRGMQVQGKAYLYRKGKRGIMVPEAARGLIADAGQRRRALFYTRSDYDRRMERVGKYMGATVIDPERGLHDAPVSTLDFMSLYPTIMYTGNMCLLTLLNAVFQWHKDAYLQHLVTTGHCTVDELFVTIETMCADSPSEERAMTGAIRFLAHHVLRGLVPEIERELLEWRKSVKREVKAAVQALKVAIKALEECPDDRALEAVVAAAKRLVAVLDKRQMSIKLICNSIYGLFGAQSSFAMCIDLADSVTRRGRSMIHYSKYITDRLINTLTLDSELARRVATFQPLRNKLVDIPSGESVVRTLVTELGGARAEFARTYKPVVGAKKDALEPGATQRSLTYFFGGSTTSSTTAAAVNSDSRSAVERATWLRTIYGDTDSIFIRFWREIDPNRAARISIAMADFITILLHLRYPTRDRHDNLTRLEFEKLYLTILFTEVKKRYAGLKRLWDYGKRCLYAPGGDEFAPSQSGLESQRRDSTRLVAEGMTPTLSVLLDYRYTSEQNIRRARAFIWRTMIAPLINGTMSMRRLIVTKQLRKSPEEYAATGKALQAHVALAARMIERAGGDRHAVGVPRPGDRIPYVIVSGLRKDRTSDRAESPAYVLKHGIPIDADYYAQQVGNAMARLFEPIINKQRTDLCGNTAEALRKKRVNNALMFLFGSLTGFHAPVDLDRYTDTTLHLDDAPLCAGIDARNIVRFRIPFSSVHDTSSGSAAAGRSTALADALPSGAHCIECRRFVAGETRGYVCQACVRASGNVVRHIAVARHMHARSNVGHLESERSAIYEHCQRCAHTEKMPTVITCANTECDVYYQRIENLMMLYIGNERLTSSVKARAIDKW